jgi:plastocyanin
MKRTLLTSAGVAAATLAIAPGVAGAATHTVFAGGDGVVRDAPSMFSPNAFLRKTITVHVGDTVRWRFRGFHTVTVPRRGDEPPAFVLAARNKVSGVRDAAGQPFWFNGRLPVLRFNPRAAAPTRGSTYDGRSFRNSGLPQGRSARPYSLRFTRAGRFDYYCAVHPGMEGHVRVVSARRRIETAASNRRRADAELAALVQQARAAAAVPPRAANIVDLGRAPRGQRFTIDRFFPTRISAKVGRPVRFTMAGQNTTEIHTVTVGPPSRRQLPFSNSQGVINPMAAYPSDPPPALPPYTGSNHGNGFLNAGVLDNDPESRANPPSTAVTFATPGRFRLKCLVDEGMDATVTVTP